MHTLFFIFERYRIIYVIIIGIYIIYVIISINVQISCTRFMHKMCISAR